MLITKPEINEYDPFYEGYINQVGENDAFEMIKSQEDDFIQFIGNMSHDKYSYAYDEGKWTIKQVVRHIIDAERMFGYRAMAIAREDKTKLPGFDDHLYVRTADDSNNSIDSMLKEFEYLRKSHIQMIGNFTSHSILNIGNANGSDISVRAIIYIIAGHLAHHMKIIKERYQANV